MIRRRHLNLLIALLLPLMVLRGLLPVGYMPVAQDGEIRMALCSDGLQQTGAAGDTRDHAPAGSDDDCLFAHAAASAPPPVIATLSAHRFVDIQSLTPRDAQLPVEVIPRAQSSRAPPTFQ